MSKTPSDYGFRMPAEWGPHAATWLAWPHNEGTWLHHTPNVVQCMCRWVRELTRERPGATLPPERVEICVTSEAMAAEAKEALFLWDVPSKRVEFHLIPNNDSWIRDFGPTFLTRKEDPGDGLGRLALVDWVFDGWGGKNEEYYGETAWIDGEVPRLIAEALGVHRFPCSTAVEGGAIDVNGAGALLATTDCLGRDKSKAEKQGYLERVFSEFLGVDHCHWLDHVPMEGDNTDGHVDNLARFVAPETIFTVEAPSKDSPLHSPLERNMRKLQSLRTCEGKPYEIVSTPLPQRLVCREPDKPAALPASYANFYIGNQVVLVPTYADAHDLRALETLQKLFPDRAVIGIDCCEYVLGQGAIHCSTQQQPLAVSDIP